MNSAALTLSLLLALAPELSPAERDAVALQAALDRAGFSPGVIDGKPGAKTRSAVEAYQAFRGHSVTGVIDAATRKALGMDDRPAVMKYRITREDVRMVAPPPKTWPEKAQVSRLGYRSLADLVAERGHCTQALLSRLNGGLRLHRLEAGNDIWIPTVWPAAPPPKASRLEVNLEHKTISVLDSSGRVASLFHCSIAKDKEKRPAGACRIEAVTKNPEYLFDPAFWPEVKGVTKKLRIPPGPRSPVGLCWIALSLPGYGIHGTPEPELIGRTGSHGCFRLTNWDALRLAKMVRPGVTVRFINDAPSIAARR